MALSVLETSTINKGIQLAKKLVEDVKPIIDEINIIYDSSGGAKETISQSELDENPQYSGLTKAELDDGMYALTSTIKGNLTTAYSQLAKLAARA